jgi:type I restriction enzyme S subunit
MSSDARLARLGDLLDITSSKRIHMADYVTSGVPFYRSKEVIERSKGNRISTELFIAPIQFEAIKQKFGSPSDGDILLTSVGTLGVPYVVKGDGDFYFKDGNLTWMRNFTEAISPQFLYYWLTSPGTQQKLDEVSIGSTQKALTISALKALEIPLPTRSIQDGIVEILGAISDRITLLRETNTTLEAIAQALFKSWFVDFDPVHAKMQGRAPEGMIDATAALFPDSFEESELGDVPKGWRSGDLNTLAELNPESWSAKHHPGRVLYVDLANTKAGQIDDYIDFSFEEAPSRARRVLRCGDVIVGTVRPGNRSFARIASDVTGLTGSTGFAVLRSREVVDQALVYIAATNDEAIDRLSHLADGGAYPAVRPEVVGTTTLVIAPKAIRNSFGEIANPLFASIGANQDCMKQLASLRDTLLPRLISGQLQLPEVGQFSESLP